MGLGSEVLVLLFSAWLAEGGEIAAGSIVMGPRTSDRNMLEIFNVTGRVKLKASEVSPTKTFIVLKLGAAADGSTDSSRAFTRAWKKACASKGRMTWILIPKGTFLVGPLNVEGPCKSTMKLIVQGVVKAQTDLNKFKEDAWVHFIYIKGLQITGGGTFDGQGSSAWPHNHCVNNPKCKLLPTVGRISSINSKSFHMNIYRSNNIKMKSIKIFAPEGSPNTDGIHIRDSTKVAISGARIGTGNDCISVGPGSYNMSITNVNCGPGHGISIGSLGKYKDEDDVVGLQVKNCVLRGTINGLRIKTWSTSLSSVALGFLFENIVNVTNPIIIDQQCCPYYLCRQKSTPSMVKIKNVSFKNIRGTSASKVAVGLLCSSKVPCENVFLKNINLRYTGPSGEHAVSSCSYVNGLSSGLQFPSSCLPVITDLL